MQLEVCCRIGSDMGEEFIAEEFSDNGNQGLSRQDSGVMETQGSDAVRLFF